MAFYKYVGDEDAVEVPGVGKCEKGEPVEFIGELEDGLIPELWEKTTKKAAKASSTPADAPADTPAGDGGE